MEYRNATYNEWGTIDCEINHEDFGWIPFTASPDDVSPRGVEIYNQIFAAGNINEYVPPEDLTGDNALNALRYERDQILISEVDPIVSNPLRWNSMTAEEQTSWTDYRQALLDLPQNNPNPVKHYNLTEHMWEWQNVTFPDVGV